MNIKRNTLGQAIDLGDWGSINFSAGNQLQETVNTNLATALKKLGLDWLLPEAEKAAAPTKPAIDPRLLIFGVGAGVLLLILAMRK